MAKAKGMRLYNVVLAVVDDDTGYATKYLGDVQQIAAVGADQAKAKFIMANAKLVAENQDVQVRCVTLFDY
jgi:hypothetical protein